MLENERLKALHQVMSHSRCVFLKSDVVILSGSISEYMPDCALKTVSLGCCSFICPNFKRFLLMV